MSQEPLKGIGAKYGTGGAFCQSISLLEVVGENAYTRSQCMRNARAKKRGDHTQARPPLCHGVSRIFLTAPLSNDAVAIYLGPGEKLLHCVKLATSSLPIQDQHLCDTFVLYQVYAHFCLSHARVRRSLPQPELTDGRGAAMQWRALDAGYAGGADRPSLDPTGGAGIRLRRDTH